MRPAINKNMNKCIKLDPVPPIGEDRGVSALKFKYNPSESETRTIVQQDRLFLRIRSTGAFYCEVREGAGKNVLSEGCNLSNGLIQRQDPFPGQHFSSNNIILRNYCY